MFHRNLMIGTNDRTLEETPNILKRIRVRQSSDVLFSAVINANVDRVVITHAEIASLLVGRQYLGFIRKFGFQKSAQFVFGKRARSRVMQSNFAVTFNRT